MWLHVGGSISLSTSCPKAADLHLTPIPLHLKERVMPFSANGYSTPTMLSCITIDI